jgi:predicted PurR-regulated permease PerM
MPSQLTGDDVNLIFYSIILVVVMFVAYYLVRLIRELIPTIRQLRRTLKELDRTIQNSQEIIYNVKSITRNVDQEVLQAQEILGVARGVVNQVATVTTTVAKPIMGIRNLMLGLGYGMKYLLKRDRRVYEEEEL